MKRMPSMKGQTPVDMSPVLMLLNDDSDDLREAYDGLKRNHKLKALVFLSSVWGIKETERRTGRPARQIKNARWMLRHYRSELKAIRSEAMQEMFQQKAFQIAAGIKPEEIMQDKKAQSVKALMDAADIARVQGAAPVGKVGEGEETVELFYRVRRKLRAVDEGGGGDDEEGGGGSDGGKAIDITSEVTVDGAGNSAKGDK